MEFWHYAKLFLANEFEDHEETDECDDADHEALDTRKERQSVGDNVANFRFRFRRWLLSKRTARYKGDKRNEDCVTPCHEL